MVNPEKKVFEELIEAGYTKLGEGELKEGRHHLWEAGVYAIRKDLPVPDRIFEVMKEFEEGLPETMKESSREITGYAGKIVRGFLDAQSVGADPAQGSERYRKKFN